MEERIITIEIIEWTDGYAFNGPKEFHDEWGNLFITSKGVLYDNMKNIANWASVTKNKGCAFTIA